MQPQVSTQTPQPANNKQLTLIIGVVIGLIVAFGGGFLVGHATSKKPAIAQQAGRFGGGMMNGQRPTIGSVTAVDSGTLTVKTNAGDTLTVKLTDNTRILTSDRQTAAASDIKTGDTVAVAGTTSGTTVTATRVTINPSFGGGAQGGGNQPAAQ